MEFGHRPLSAQRQALVLAMVQHRRSALLAVLPAETSAVHWVQRAAPLLLPGQCASLKARLYGPVSAVAAQVQAPCADHLRQHDAPTEAASWVSIGSRRIPRGGMSARTWSCLAGFCALRWLRSCFGTPLHVIRRRSSPCMGRSSGVRRMQTAGFHAAPRALTGRARGFKRGLNWLLRPAVFLPDSSADRSRSMMHRRCTTSRVT